MQVAVQINMGRVFALKNVRIFYKKFGRMKFISHLDMNRFMSRAIKRANIPIWHTEGFHPHPYITFALPLSLGFESEYEIMDIRLTDDDYPLSLVLEKLNSAFPEYIKAFSVEEPFMKVGSIGFADFKIHFSDNNTLKEALESFLKQDELICTKTTKKGNLKEIDIAKKLKNYSISGDENGTVLYLTLPAGSDDNLNPELLLNLFFEKYSNEYYSYSITRAKIYDKNLNIFR